MTPATPASPPGAVAGGYAACWQAARQLRAAHPGWLVIWVARTGRYHAYRLSVGWGDPGLSSPESAGLAARIEQASHAASRQPRPRAAAST